MRMRDTVSGYSIIYRNLFLNVWTIANMGGISYNRGRGFTYSPRATLVTNPYAWAVMSFVLTVVD